MNVIRCVADKTPIEELTEQVARLSVSLMNKGSFDVKKTNVSREHSSFKKLLPSGDCSAANAQASSVDVKKLHVNTDVLAGKEGGDLIVLSDDENESETPMSYEHSSFKKLLPSGDSSASDAQATSVAVKKLLVSDSDVLVGKEGAKSIVLSDDNNEPKTYISKDVNSHFGSSQTLFDDKVVSANADEQVVYPGPVKGTNSRIDKAMNPVVASKPGLESDMVEGRTAASIKSKVIHEKRKDVDTKLLREHTKENDTLMTQPSSTWKDSSDESMIFKTKDQKDNKEAIETGVTVLQELVQDSEIDLEFGFSKLGRRRQTLTIKPSISGPKRQVIQLDLPVKNRSSLFRVDGRVKRFKSARLDDWFRAILELDFFATVGLSVTSEEDNQKFNKLKQVPVCFESAEEYIEIFRPLLVEEFKAQLLSSFQEANSVEEMSCGSLSIMSVERIDDFHIIRCVRDDFDNTGSKSCLENDLILLTRQPLQNSAPDVHIVGKVFSSFSVII